MFPKMNLHKHIQWNKYINISPNIINETDINYINNNFSVYGVLKDNDVMLDYILKNFSNSVCDILVNKYNLDNTYNINIKNIYISSKITSNINTSIIASIFLKDDLIFLPNKTEEISIKSGTIIFQNNKYTNKSKNQILIEFEIDINII